MAPKLGRKKSLRDVMKNAGKKALGGGLAGALAMVVQVLALMWMRTTINYQHAKGMRTMAQALHQLVQARKITLAEAEGALTDPTELRDMFRAVSA